MKRDDEAQGILDRLRARLFQAGPLAHKPGDCPFADLEGPCVCGTEHVPQRVAKRLTDDEAWGQHSLPGSSFWESCTDLPSRGGTP